MIEEALNRLIEVGDEKNICREVFESEDTVHMWVRDGNSDGACIIEFPKPRPERHHWFETLVSFVGYLNSAHCKSEGVVMTASNHEGRPAVVADLDYMSHVPQRAVLPMTNSEEYNALLTLLSQKGLTQRELWKLLISKLFDCIDASLLLSIGSIKMKVEGDSSAEIDITGMGASSGSHSVSINFQAKGGADSTVQIALDYVWRGRFWSCFDRVFEVPLRLELDNSDGGLRFIFHARRLDTILQEARAALTEEISKAMPDHFTVYQAAL